MAIQTTTATFTGAEPLDGDQPYIDLTWPTAYASAAVYRLGDGPNITDGNGGVSVNFKNKTGSGVRVIVSDQFVGTVEVTAYDV